MNQEQVIEWAREAGGLHDPMIFLHAYERFAALVAADAAAKEREACAQVVDAKEKSIYLFTNTTYLSECSAAIRARGNKEGV